MPRLTTLKPKVATLRTSLQQAPSAAVERKRGSAGVRDRNRIRARDCGMCQECKRQGRTARGVAVDHIVPLWKGGSNDDANLELLCQPCHDAKSRAEATERSSGNINSPQY